MPNGVCALALSVALQVGAPGPSETPNYPALQNAYSHHGFEGQYEQRFPLDSQQNWVHGYWQEIPAYGGYAFFRPYNYKAVLSQSQISAGWGQSPALPYSQQFWHKYQDQATMLKMSRNERGVYSVPAAPAYAAYPPPTATSFVRQPGYMVPVSAPQTVVPADALPPGAYYVPTDEVTEQVLPNPALQPAVGSQYINPANFAPR